ncbi:MAG TPA: hypothetical protein VKB08_10300 [Bradyrhizobium sp.]|nr:hypothetical protein [Bradyrhizobium sp.]
MSDLDPNRPVGTRDRDGLGTGTIAAIIAAVLIIGALLLWQPWNGNNSTASNPSGTTTTGSSGTGGTGGAKGGAR